NEKNINAETVAEPVKSYLGRRSKTDTGNGRETISTTISTDPHSYHPHSIQLTSIRLPLYPQPAKSTTLARNPGTLVSQLRDHRKRQLEQKLAAENTRAEWQFQVCNSTLTCFLVPH